MHTVGCPRTCLGFTNFVFFIFGLIGFTVCIWCALNPKFFRDVNYTITKSSYVATIADFVTLKFFLTSMTTILIPISIMTMLTSCCGILGAGCKLKCALKSYMFLVSVLSGVACYLFFISGIYNIYTDNEKTKQYLLSSLNNVYGRENDLFTFLWNYIMMKHNCCGVVSYKDFENSNWRKANLDLLYPIECCVLANKTALIPASLNCSRTLETTIESYKDVGCMGALIESIIRNKPSLIFYIVLFGVIYGVLTLFAYCMLKGQPLLGSLGLGGIDDSQLPSIMPRKHSLMPIPPSGMNPSAPSCTSLENMMFADEPPQKVMRVVSAANPFQSYKFAPPHYPPMPPRSIPVKSYSTVRPQM